MKTLVDTSILIDVLRGSEAAANLLRQHRARGPLCSSLVVKAEVLAGMRTTEETQTLGLLAALEWHEVNSAIAETAGRLGREWLPSHGGIDTADLLIASTALELGCELLTRNIRHFPMFPDLTAPY